MLFKTPPFILKNFLYDVYDIVPVHCTLEKIDQWQQRKGGTESLVQLSEQSSELVSVFKEASRNFIIPYLFHDAVLKFKNFAHVLNPSQATLRNRFLFLPPT
jgi:hypothetical protein